MTQKFEEYIEDKLRLIKSDLETEIIEKQDQSDFVLKCAKCDSLKIVKAGRNNGKPKFQCQDCKHQFIHPLLREEKKRHSLAPKENPDVYCYHCKSQKRDFCYNGKTKKGNQRFYCNECQRWFLDPKERFIHDVPCPKCHQCQCSKRGTSHSGKQKYYCSSCDYRFVQNR